MLVPPPFAATCISLTRRALALTVVAIASLAHADIVQLTNGNVLRGRIGQRLDDRIVLQTPTAELILPNERIDTSVDEAPGDDAAYFVGELLKAGRPLHALDELQRAMAAGHGAEAIAIATKDRVRLLRDLRTHMADEPVEYRRLVLAIEADPAATTELRLMMARAAADLGAHPEATDMLARVPLEELRDRPEEHAWAITFLRDSVRRLALDGHYAMAVEKIEQLRLVDDDTTSQMALLGLAESARLRDRALFAESIDALAGRVAPEFPAIARNRAEIVVRDMVAWAAAHEREPEARVWARDAGTLLADEGIGAENALYGIEAERLLRQNKPDEALALLDELPDFERPTELKRLWARARFAVDRREIGDANAAKLFELAQWGAERGLDEEALGALVHVRLNPLLKDAADQRISQLRGERELRVLAQALAAFDQGLYEKTRDLCADVIGGVDGDNDTTRRVRELADLAQKKILMNQQQRPYVAEVHFQQAERAYFLGQLDVADQHLDTILDHYAETPAAQRAARLVPDVNRARDLQALERLVRGSRASMPEGAASAEMSKLDAELKRLMEAL